MTGVVLGAFCVLLGGGFVALLLVLVAANARRARERRDGLAGYAAHREWAFVPDDPRLVGRFAGPPFGAGHDARATNVIHGRHSGRAFTAFDYTYRTSNGDNADTVHHYSVVATALGVVVPGLSVARQGSLGRLVGRLFGSDLIIGDPVFDDAFRVSADDPRFAADVLHPAMRRLVLQGGELTWRFSVDSLLLIRIGSHVPTEIDARLALMDAILAQVPAAVWANLRAADPSVE